MSLINNTLQRVKFISYTGAYPNLCGGVLTLEIDGKEFCFGHDYEVWDPWKTDGNYQHFWSSGGNCGFTDDYANAFVNTGEWVIDVSLLPEELRPLATEIDEVFNENVKFGCCGGCL